MKKLIRVNRGRPELYFPVDFDLRDEARYLHSEKIIEEMPIERQADFFVIEDRSVPEFVQKMAELNPGCDVEVYLMEGVGHCPAGDFILKRVTADGILPA